MQLGITGVLTRALRHETGITKAVLFVFCATLEQLAGTQGLEFPTHTQRLIASSVGHATLEAKHMVRRHLGQDGRSELREIRALHKTRRLCQKEHKILVSSDNTCRVPISRLCRSQMKRNVEHLIGLLHPLRIELEGSLRRGMAKASG